VEDGAGADSARFPGFARQLGDSRCSERVVLRNGGPRWSPPHDATGP
jgi:hypothetical protein